MIITIITMTEVPNFLEHMQLNLLRTVMVARPFLATPDAEAAGPTIVA